MESDETKWGGASLLFCTAPQDEVTLDKIQRLMGGGGVAVAKHK
jgi:hypothetical protein